MKKEVVKCKRCGVTLPDNADICPSCGLLSYSMPFSPGNPTKRDNRAAYLKRDQSQNNDNLVPCPRCNNPISPNAFVCPHCGETLRKKPVPIITLIAAVVLAFIIFYCLFIRGISMFFG